MEDRRYQHPRYRLQRKFWKLAGADVRVFDVNESLAFFAHQKAWKLKEDIRIYADEQKQTELIRMSARKIIDFSGAYDIYDAPSNQKIGVLKRKGLKSAFLRDQWIIMDAQDREIGHVIENRPFMAFLRRWVELVSLFSPQSYNVEVGGRVAAEFRQGWNPFLFKLNLDFSMDPKGQALDRRIGIAAAILLSTIEGKQRG